MFAASTRSCIWIPKQALPKPVGLRMPAPTGSRGERHPRAATRTTPAAT